MKSLIDVNSDTSFFDLIPDFDGGIFQTQRNWHLEV